MGFTSGYEIFQKLPAKQPTWLEAATTLPEAKTRIKELAVMFPADYFMLETENACLVVPCASLNFEVEPTRS